MNYLKSPLKAMQASSECIMQLILPNMHIVMIKIALGMIKFLAGSCLNGLGIVMKEPWVI